MTVNLQLSCNVKNFDESMAPAYDTDAYLYKTRNANPIEFHCTVGRTVRRSRRGDGNAPLPSSTATDPGTGISPLPGSRQRSLHRSSARNSNSGACYAAVLSRVPVAVIAAWWTTLRRTSRDLKILAKMGFILVTSLAVIAFAPPLVRSVFSITRAPSRL